MEPCWRVWASIKGGGPVNPENSLHMTNQRLRCRVKGISGGNGADLQGSGQVSGKRCKYTGDDRSLCGLSGSEEVQNVLHLTVDEP